MSLPETGKFIVQEVIFIASTHLSGIDVSRLHGIIDWQKVKKSGIDFVFIKCSQGGSVSTAAINPFTDSFFQHNIEGAYAAGVKCGAYHVLTGTTHEDVISEAEYVVHILEPFKSLITFPVALNFVEARYKTFHKTYNAILIRLFTDVIHSAGYIPILYTTRSFLKSSIDRSSLGDLDVWLVRYNAPRKKEPVPDDFKQMTVWQWTGMGCVDGICGNVALNHGLYDYSQSQSVILQTKPGFSVGDVVRIKSDAKVYYNGGAVIPAWVKNDYDHIITKNTYYNKKVFKGGSQCVMLGKKISHKTGKTVAGINTWIAVENIEKKQ